ncbi:RDD family protein [Bdellovibrio sp. HCB209]|uniref:RDD family protein n=1 Tax=Bdellovibrio sp. HCB209 TaxID=3394354 RepID=UPI0039B41A31
MNEFYVASTWKRFIAQGIDQIFLLVCYVPFATLFYQVYTSDTDIYVSLFQLFMLFMVPALYEAVSLMVAQATPGKWLLGLKVVPNHDPTQPLEYSQCILRPLTSRLTFFFSWAIYALAFFRYDRTHLSDWVAETRVVQFKPRPTRPKIRWIIGTFFVLSYAYEGMAYASSVLNQINWQEGKVELRALITLGSMEDMQFDMNMEEEGE